MNFLLRKLFKNIPPKEEGKTLLLRVSGSAFQVFKDENFRKLVDFDNQEQMEQDRIFNELVVTAIVQLMFMIESKLAHEKIKADRIRFWNSLHDMIPDLHVEFLKSKGAEVQFADIWKKLLKSSKKRV